MLQHGLVFDAQGGLHLVGVTALHADEIVIDAALQAHFPVIAQLLFDGCGKTIPVVTFAPRGIAEAFDLDTVRLQAERGGIVTQFEAQLPANITTIANDDKLVVAVAAFGRDHAHFDTGGGIELPIARATLRQSRPGQMPKPQCCEESGKQSPCGAIR